MDWYLPNLIRNSWTTLQNRASKSKGVSAIQQFTGELLMWYLVIFRWSTINRGLCFMGLHLSFLGPSWSWSDDSLIYNYLCNHSLSPLKLSVRILLMVRCTRNNLMYDKVCQWLATGRWFSPVSSANKTDRHDISKILLKVVLNTINRSIFCDQTCMSFQIWENYE